MFLSSVGWFFCQYYIRDLYYDYHTNLSLFTPSEDFIFFKLPRKVLCRNVLTHFHNCVIKMLIFVYLNWNFYTKYMYSDCVVMSLKYQIFSIIWYPLLNLHYIQRYIYNYTTTLLCVEKIFGNYPCFIL